MKYPDDFLNKVIQGDCLEIMKQMPGKCVDLVLTDPPYGIKADKGSSGFGSSQNRRYEDDNWDSFVPSKEYFDEILRISKVAIIFGGNCFTDRLPVSKHWIVWDKKGSMPFDNPFSDCELGWTSIEKKPIKKYTVIQQGFVSEERDRFHPTQKPVSLFNQIIKDYSKDGDIVLDCFLGSGTTAVACKQTNRNFIGVELSQKYCDIANERLKQDLLF